MINLDNTRKRKLAVVLICEKLGIDEKELNAFISNGKVKSLKQEPKKSK